MLVCFWESMISSLIPSWQQNFDRQSSGFLTQSEYESAYNVPLLDFWNMKPRLTVTFTYLSIFFTAARCLYVRVWMYLQTLFTTNKISGLVIVWYCNSPKIFLYWNYASPDIERPNLRSIFLVADMGAEMGLLQLSILAFFWSCASFGLTKVVVCQTLP